VLLATIRTLSASECHASLTAIRNLPAHSLPYAHAGGAYAAPDQRAAQSDGEPGRTGARARSRGAGTDLMVQSPDTNAPSCTASM
jgi:hypothetical protein